MFWKYGLISQLVVEDFPKYLKRAIASFAKIGTEIQYNSELLHTAMQLSPSLPHFHSVAPFLVHSSSMGMLMLLLKPSNPDATTGVKETLLYLPATQLVHVEAPASEYVPAAQEMQVVGSGISERSSAHNTSMLAGAMPCGSNIAFPFFRPLRK
jgi:hypothetical protein